MIFKTKTLSNKYWNYLFKVKNTSITAISQIENGLLSKTYSAFCTWAITSRAQQVQTNCDHVCSRIVGYQVVHRDLVRISKVENGLLEPKHRAYIKWLKKLIVKVSVRYASPKIVQVLAIFPNLKIDICTGSPIAAEQLEENRWLILYAVRDVLPNNNT